MIAALVAVVCLAGLLAWREYLHTQERKEAQAERAQLLDRIESPGTVVVQRAQEKAEDEPFPEIAYEHPWSGPVEV